MLSHFSKSAAFPAATSPLWQQPRTGRERDTGSVQRFFGLIKVARPYPEARSPHNGVRVMCDPCSGRATR